MTRMFNTGEGGSGGSHGNQTPLTMGSPLALALVQNQHPYSSAMRAESETKPEPELCQLEAELRRMREANDSLIQEIRMQQLVSERNVMICPMMLQQQHNGGEPVPVGEYKIGGHVGGLQTASAYADVAGGALRFPPIADSTTAAATSGGMIINSTTSAATKMRGAGMMGMHSSMNTMMMPNSIILDGNGMSDIMNLKSSSVSVPCTSSLTDSFTSMTGTSISSCNSTAAASSASDITQPISNVSNTDEMTDADVEEGELQASDEPNWERRYRELVQYKSEHGHTRVPARWKSNPQLGRWVMTQRRQFTILIQGHSSPLTAERMSRLNEIGFQWALRADKITMWNRMFSELKTFKEEFGNCVVPQRYPANPKLGTWVHTQRRQYKLMLEGKKSAMNEEKIAALDSLGFTWVAKTNGWSMYES